MAEIYKTHILNKIYGKIKSTTPNSGKLPKKHYFKTMHRLTKIDLILKNLTIFEFSLQNTQAKIDFESFQLILSPRQSIFVLFLNL